MIMSSVIAIAGIGFAWMFYVASPAIPAAIARTMKPLYMISQGKFFLDEIFTGLIVLPLIGIAKLATLFDKYVIDWHRGFRRQSTESSEYYSSPVAWRCCFVLCRRDVGGCCGGSGFGADDVLKKSH